MNRLYAWYALWIIGFVILATVILGLVRSGLERRDQIGLIAVGVAFISLSLSIYVSTISRATARAETFRQMRGVFFEFRKNLPDDWHTAKALPEGGRNSEQFKTLIRYWQYAFDEWFITTELNPRIMRPLWDKYYEQAIATAARTAPVLAGLFAAYHAPGPLTDRKFMNEVINHLATDDSRRAAVKLALDHHIAIPEGFDLEKYK